jgi:hypothetical protein
MSSLEYDYDRDNDNDGAIIDTSALSSLFWRISSPGLPRLDIEDQILVGTGLEGAADADGITILQRGLAPDVQLAVAEAKLVRKSGGTRIAGVDVKHCHRGIFIGDCHGLSGGEGEAWSAISEHSGKGGAGSLRKIAPAEPLQAARLWIIDMAGGKLDRRVLD